MTRRELFDRMLDDYDNIYIFILLNYPGVELPEGIAEIAPNLTMLRLEPGNPANNRDLFVEDEQWSATMSINGMDWPVYVPWESVAILGCEDCQVNWAINPLPKDEPPPKPKAASHLKVVK